ncbi:P-loop containing nucleoside triphosphate hydrolase protein [Mycena alexandri]|uniref:P-loop containing nucleoside triphosphate hydrolase protein n=1 Tax=Mycena alexandri TaxID=1745969 RepID=A0AAD6T9V8_9AGAR|nr:P-loop containing nucleoside triphosphate hydrolase protein [Mycena alexandri]
MAAVVQSINNCPPPSRNFQGRQTILEKMHQFFTTDSGKQLIYVLHGLGGAGKTQIALKFIQESLASFSDTFFVDASTLNTIETALKNIAVSKSVGDSAQDALKWLQSKKGWLLFLDNADDPKINLNLFLPQCGHGNIIITSRNPGLRTYGEHSPVLGMEELDATTLLLRSAAKENSEENLQIAADIVKELFYLPLAIVQAGAFISKSEDLNGYLGLYIQNQAQLLREKPEQSHDHYAWTVYTTWQISFDQLSQPAAMFLQLCSCLHYTGISEDIFSNASKYSFPFWLPPQEDLQEPLQALLCFLGPTGAWSSLKFLAVTNEIKAYSLISFNAATKVFSIHPLVHAWSRSTLVDEGASHLCIRSILGMSISEIPDHDIILPSLRLMPHVDLVTGFNANVGADFRAAFWSIYLGAGKLKEAQNLIEQTAEKYRLVFGEEHLASLDAMHRLAVTYQRLGEYKKAKKLEVKVLEKWTKLLGEDHLATLTVMGDLAVTHNNLGEYKEAQELEVVVLEKRTKLLGKDHPHTSRAMGNLARTHNNLGEYKEAQELEVVVLEKRTKLLGEDHPDTSRAMGNLARTHAKLGEYKEAQKLQVVVLEKRTNILGEDHPYTLIAVGDLAVTHCHLEEYKEAKELQVAMLEKWTTLLGEDYPETLSTMGNLAVTHHSLGEYKEAQELQVVVLEKRTKLLGENHPETLMAMGNLAVTHCNLGEHKKAQELQIMVLEKRTKLLGEDHPYTLIAMGDLALTHCNLGEYEKAQEFQVVVVEKRRQFLGGRHPHTSTYRQLNKLTEADKLEQLIQA